MNESLKNIKEYIYKSCFDYYCEEYNAEFNLDLNCFIILFKDNNIALTHYNPKKDKFCACYNSEITDEQNKLVDNFIEKAHRLKVDVIRFYYVLDAFEYM